jgi:hypothetical protein
MRSRGKFAAHKLEHEMAAAARKRSRLPNATL